MMIPLTCTSCGAPLDVPKASVFEGQEGGVVVITGGETYTCSHCNTQHIPGTQMHRHGSGSVVVQGDANGSVIIGGNASGNVIVTGNGGNVSVRR